MMKKERNGNGNGNKRKKIENTLSVCCVFEGFKILSLSYPIVYCSISYHYIRKAFLFYSLLLFIVYIDKQISYLSIFHVMLCYVMLCCKIPFFFSSLFLFYNYLLLFIYFPLLMCYLFVLFHLFCYFILFFFKRN